MITTRTAGTSPSLHIAKLRGRVRKRLGSGSSRCSCGTGASAQALMEANADFMQAADGQSKHHQRRLDVKSSIPPQNVMRLCCLSKRGSNAKVRFANRHQSAYILVPRSEDDNLKRDLPLPQCQQLRCHQIQAIQVLLLS